MVNRFRLAPMDTVLQLMTGLCLAIPVVIGYFGFRAPRPVGVMLYGTSGFLLAIYAFIYLYLRPIGFVVAPEGLVIRWPVRTRTIDAASIVSARVVDRDALREQFGRIMRVGAGGVGGGFGLARTSRGTHELWVSRTDWLVVVECRERRSLLLTPDDPERFVSELTRVRQASAT